MNIAELFPLLKDTCHFEVFQVLPTAPVVVPAGGFHEVCRFKNKQGYLYGALISGDQPLATGQIEYKSLAQLRYVTAQPFSFNVNGITLPNGSWWCSVYNTVTGIYAIVYIPFSGHELPFDEHFVFRVLAPPLVALTINYLSAIVLIIDDKKEFWKRVRHAYSVEKWTMKIPTEEVETKNEFRRLPERL